MNEPKPIEADTRGGSCAPAPGSVWDRVNAVFAEADKLEAMTNLRMERMGETRESAFEWAKEMYQQYSPNTDYANRNPLGDKQ